MKRLCAAALTAMVACGQPATPVTPTPAASSVASPSPSAIASSTSAPRVDAGPIGAPRLVAPIAGAKVHTATPSITVELAAGTDSAEIELCSDRACATSVARVMATKKGARASVATKTLQPGRYYARARGVRGGVVGTDASAASPFMVGAPATAVDTSDLAFFEPTEKELAARYKEAKGVVAIGDVDGDGWADAVGTPCPAGASDCKGFALFPGGPNAATVKLDGLTGTTWIAIGDANGDGYADAVLSSSSGASFLPGGARGFGAGTQVSVVGGIGVRSPEGHDLNGDGFMDFVTMRGPGASAMLVHLGSGRGLAETPTEFATGAPNYECLGDALSYGDVNGDGYTDMAVGAYCSGHAYVFLGGRTLDTKPAYTLAQPPVKTKVPARFGFGVSLRDADNDGLDDLFVSTACYQDEREKGLCQAPLTYLYRAAKDGLRVDKPEPVVTPTK